MSVISSLLAIPAAYFIVCSGLLLTIASFLLPPAAEFIGLLVTKAIGFLTTMLEVLSSLSWSTIQRLYITGPELLLILTLLLLVSLRVLTDDAFWIKPLVTLASVFLIIHSVTFVARTQRTLLTIYPAENNIAFEIFRAGKSYQYGMDKLSEFEGRSAIKNRLAHYVRSSSQLAASRSPGPDENFDVQIHNTYRPNIKMNGRMHVFCGSNYRGSEFLRETSQKSGNIIHLQTYPCQIQLQ